MSKTNREIETRIAGGLGQMAPDDAESLLRRPVDKAVGTEEYLTGPVPEKKRRARGAACRWIAAAACLVLLLTTGYRFQFSTCYAVGLDANPSLTLTLNRMEQVLGVQANNEDGEKVLEDLSLNRVGCDDAVEMILDRMLELGYLREGQGQVLLSVQTGDTQNGERLRSRLSAEADAVLGSALEEHGVFSRLVAGENAWQPGAEKYGVTAGKAALAERLSSDHPDLKEEDLARMPIEEMMDLLEEKEIDLSPYGSYTGTPRGRQRPEEQAQTLEGETPQDTSPGQADPALDREGTEQPAQRQDPVLQEREGAVEQGTGDGAPEGVLPHQDGKTEGSGTQLAPDRQGQDEAGTDGKDPLRLNPEKQNPEFSPAGENTGVPSPAAPAGIEGDPSGIPGPGTRGQPGAAPFQGQ